MFSLNPKAYTQGPCFKNLFLGLWTCGIFDFMYLSIVNTVHFISSKMKTLSFLQNYIFVFRVVVVALGSLKSKVRGGGIRERR